MQNVGHWKCKCEYKCYYILISWMSNIYIHEFIQIKTQPYFLFYYYVQDVHYCSKVWVCNNISHYYHFFTVLLMSFGEDKRLISKHKKNLSPNFWYVVHVNIFSALPVSGAHDNTVSWISLGWRIGKALKKGTRQCESLQTHKTEKN